MQTVQDHATSAVPTAAPSDSVGAVLDALRGRSFDTVNAVYVIADGGILAGVAPLSELLPADPDARLGAVMRANPPTVLPETDQEDAASLAIREDLSAVAITDAGGRFAGVFPPRAIMDVLRQEHLEDIHHLAGILRNSEAAVDALHGSPIHRARFRMPWLVLGLTGSLIATGLTASFEETLTATIELAFFIPLVVYLADAVGAQSEAVAVRALSLTRSGIGQLLPGEMLTGAMIGVLLALIVVLFAFAAFGHGGIAAVLAISVISACTIATIVGLTLPWLFAQTGWDPALASGPVATTIQDVMSLLVYFVAATLIL